MQRSSGWNWRLERVKEKTNNLLKRLELVKDMDPFNRKLLNDSYNLLQELQSEVDRLVYHNNNLMNVIYQNQTSIEE